MQIFIIRNDGEVHAVNIEDLIGESLSPNEYYILKNDETKTIYSWIGSSCPPRIKFFGAGKSREVRGQVGMDYSLLQVDEGDEPPELLKKFKPLFEKAETPIEKRENDNQKNQKETECMQIFIIRDDDKLHEINPENSIRESLSSSEFYILKDDGSRTIYTWIGRSCPVRKKFLGARSSQEFHGQVGLHYRLIHVDEGEEPQDLLEKIKGKPCSGS